MSDETVSIKIPIWVYRGLEENAIKRGLPIGQYIYELIRDDMQKSIVIRGMNEKLRRLEALHRDELNKHLVNEDGKGDSGGP